MNRFLVVVMIVAGVALGVASFGPGLSFGGGGRAASDFQLYSTRSKLVQLSDLRGKVVVLDFWASWCGPCRAAIPAMQRLHERYAADGLVVLGININDNQDPAEFMHKMGATYTTLVSGEEVASDYNVRGIPTLIVIDPQGNIILRESGWAPQMERTLRGVIEGALTDATP